SVEQALRFSDGYLVIDVMGDEPLYFNEHYACPFCDFSVDQLEPRLFSFNAPFGACSSCDGIGSRLTVDPELVIPDDSLTLEEGVFVPWQSISSNYYPSMLEQFAKSQKIPLDVPFKDLAKEAQELLKYGSPTANFKFTYKQMSGAERTVDHVFEGVFN